MKSSDVSPQPEADPVRGLRLLKPPLQLILIHRVPPWLVCITEQGLFGGDFYQDGHAFGLGVKRELGCLTDAMLPFLLEWREPQRAPC